MKNRYLSLFVMAFVFLPFRTLTIAPVIRKQARDHGVSEQIIAGCQKHGHETVQACGWGPLCPAKGRDAEVQCLKNAIELRKAENAAWHSAQRLKHRQRRMNT